MNLGKDRILNTSLAHRPEAKGQRKQKALRLEEGTVGSLARKCTRTGNFSTIHQ